MLCSFYDTGLLRFDFPSRAWAWDLESIRLTAVQEDVVDVLCQQMLSLSGAAQTVLQYAACSGNIFNLHALAVVTGFDMPALVTGVRELEEAGHLLCTSHSHDLVLLAEAVRAAKLAKDADDAGSADASAAGTNDAITAVGTQTDPMASGGLLTSVPLPISSAQQLQSIHMQFQHDKIQAVRSKESTHKP